MTNQSDKDTILPRLHLLEELVVDIYQLEERKRQAAREDEERQAAQQVRRAEEDALRRLQDDHDAAMADLNNEISRNEMDE